MSSELAPPRPAGEGRDVPALRRRFAIAQTVKAVAPWIVWIGAATFVLVQWREVGSVGTAPGAAVARTIALTAPSDTLVVEVKKRPGDVVQKGDVLVQLDLAAADLAVAIADAELQRLRLVVPAKAEDLRGTDLETADRLAAASEQAALDAARIAAEAGRDEAELAQLEAQVARQTELVEQKLKSADALQDLLLRKAALARRVTEYPAQIAAAKRHEAATQLRLASWRSARPPADAAAARTAPDAAAAKAGELKLLQLVAARDALVVKAPSAGRVQDVLVGAGDPVRGGQPLISIVDDVPTEVVVWVDETAARRVKVGDHAVLLPSDRIGERLSGTVTSLAPAVAEAPERFRLVPAEPRFARAVTVKVDAAALAGVDRPLPGQAYDVAFEAP